MRMSAGVPRYGPTTWRPTMISPTCPIGRCSSQMLNAAIKVAERYDRKFSVMFVDLDRFKLINDTLGHAAGDILLKGVGTQFRQCLRDSDVLARFGGDEFVILLHEVSDVAQVSAVALSAPRGCGTGPGRQAFDYVTSRAPLK